MKILHFVTSLDASIGGPIRAIVDLANALIAIGHTVTIVTTDSSAIPSGLENSKSLQVVYIDKPRFFNLALSLAARRALAKEIQSADVIHTHGAWSYANILVCRLASQLRKPYVISLHGMLDDWPMRQRRIKKRMYLALVGTRWLSRAARIHLAARLEFEQARKWFPMDLAAVIPNLLDLQPFRRLPDGEVIEPMLRRLHPGRARVLFLSRLHPKKGLGVLLRAGALLKSRNKPVSIIVAGEGAPEYVAALRSIAVELALQDDEVIFLGAVKGDRKLALFGSCDVFALPTYHENFGYVLVEALACGLCIVTTRAVAIASELHASGAAELVEATPEQFADALEILLADRNALNTRGQAGRDWALAWFDGQKITRQYEEMYFRCVGQGRG